MIFYYKAFTNIISGAQGEDVNNNCMICPFNQFQTIRVTTTIKDTVLKCMRLSGSDPDCVWSKRWQRRPSCCSDGSLRTGHMMPLVSSGTRQTHIPVPAIPATPRQPCQSPDLPALSMTSSEKALSVKTSLFTYAYHGASKSIRSRHSLFTMWPLRVCPPANARTAEHYEYRGTGSMTLNMGQCLLTYSKVFSNAVLLFKIQQYVIV